MEWFGLAASLISIVTAIFAIAGWWQGRKLRQELAREKERQNQEITVKLQHGAHTYELPVKIRRAEFERAEILGRLGMIPMMEKGKRYSITYLNLADFLRQINIIRQGQVRMLLTIPCEQEEYEQFNFKQAQANDRFLARD